MNIEKFVGKNVVVVLKSGSKCEGILEYGVEPFKTYYTIDPQGKSNLSDNWGRVFFKEDRIKSIRKR